jgi:hypothetical protein
MLTDRWELSGTERVLVLAAVPMDGEAQPPQWLVSCHFSVTYSAKRIPL